MALTPEQKADKLIERTGKKNEAIEIAKELEKYNKLNLNYDNLKYWQSVLSYLKTK